MAVVNKPWSGAASKYGSTGAYCDACLINENTGSRDNWTQDNCHLPVKEPGGAINRNGVTAAAARINQVKSSPQKIAAAKARLRGLYQKLGMTIPDNIK
jgi:hypothetical protein